MKNYELDASLLPQVWLTWASTKNKQFDKRYWLNCQTGEKKTTPESWMLYKGENNLYCGNWNDLGGYGVTDSRTKNGKIWVAANSKLNYAYVKYHPDIDRLEFASVKFDTSRTGEHKWTFDGDRCFVAKDKTVINEKGETLNRFYIDPIYYYTVYSFRYYLSALLRRYHIANMVDEFHKFIGGNTFTIGNGSVVTAIYGWDIKRWYETVQKTRSTSKTQKIIDDLISIPLSDSSDFAKRYPAIKNKWSEWYTETIGDIVYFERVNDQWSVLRGFLRNDADELNESWRFYIGDNGKNIIASHTNNDWIPSSKVTFNWRENYYIANIDDAVDKCNRIKYMYSCINDVKKDHKNYQMVRALLNMLKHPEIEQVIKIGGRKIGTRMLDSSTPIAELRNTIGGYYKKSGSSILRKMGMTKYQFSKYCELDNNRYISPLLYMRQIFGDDISYMDNKSYDSYLPVCNNMDSYLWNSIIRLKDNFDIDKTKMFKNMVRLYQKDNRITHMISDTVTTYFALNEDRRPEVDFYFDDISDVTRVHDAVIALKRIQDEEQRARWDMEAKKRREQEEKRRVKIDEERKQYEYEDDKYIIRLPKDLNEIISEGSVQHICIGGYTSRHANGDTNLFFLRKKDTESVPFYAIEMDNSKRIIQIHGFGNRWLGNDPDAIPTVVRWLRKNGITCQQHMLTCKATGYGGSNDHVPMPVVD